MLKLNYNYAGSMIHEDIKYGEAYNNKDNKNLMIIAEKQECRCQESR